MADIPEDFSAPFVTVPVTPKKPPDMHTLAALARDLATGMGEESKILEKYDITPEEFEKIATIPYFKHALEEGIREWQSPMKTADRIRLKSAMITEDLLPRIGDRMLNPDEPLRDTVEAAKFVAKLGDLGEPKNAGQSHERVSITINMGDETVKFDKVREVQQLSEGSPPVIDLQAIREGASPLEQISEQPKGDSPIPTGQPETEPAK